MNYRYGIIFKECNDYVRKIDMSWLTFLDEKKQKSLRIDFDDKGRLFINDDVNANRVEQLSIMMLENDIDINIVSTRTWKSLPDILEKHE